MIKSVTKSSPYTWYLYLAFMIPLGLRHFTHNTNYIPGFVDSCLNVRSCVHQSALQACDEKGMDDYYVGFCVVCKCSVRSKILEIHGYATADFYIQYFL